MEDLKHVVNEEKTQLDEIAREMQMIKNKYDIKRQELQQLNIKVEEKSKLLSEAKKAYTKILDNTNMIIEAIDNENEDQSIK